MKLTGAYTLLSNALSSEEGQGTSLGHCPQSPASLIFQYQPEPTLRGRAIDQLTGVPG